jgi:hypothetical protein
MTIGRTPQGITADLQVTCGEKLREAVRSTAHQSLAMVAAAVGRDPSVIEDWASGAKPFPVYALAHPGVSRAVRGAVIAWLVQRLEEDAPQTSVELATTNVLHVAGELLATVAPMLSDGRIDSNEQRTLRPLMLRLHRMVGEWIAQHGGSEARAS